MKEWNEKKETTYYGYVKSILSYKKLTSWLNDVEDAFFDSRSG